jgi:hypothetical protein
MAKSAKTSFGAAAQASPGLIIESGVRLYLLKCVAFISVNLMRASTAMIITRQSAKDIMNRPGSAVPLVSSPTCKYILVSFSADFFSRSFQRMVLVHPHRARV